VSDDLEAAVVNDATNGGDLVGTFDKITSHIQLPWQNFPGEVISTWSQFRRPWHKIRLTTEL
jgi:hypothetical protein